MVTFWEPKVSRSGFRHALRAEELCLLSKRSISPASNVEIDGILSNGPVDEAFESVCANGILSDPIFPFGY